MVFEVCCEVRRLKAKPAGAASFLVGTTAPVYKTSHIIPSSGYLLELKQCRGLAGQLWMWHVCLLRKKEPLWGFIGENVMKWIPVQYNSYLVRTSLQV